jgi:hypothetical protein
MQKQTTPNKKTNNPKYRNKEPLIQTQTTPNTKINNPKYKNKQL